MNKKLLEVVACPKCKTSLQKGENLLLCDKCKVKYQVKEEIPILLINEVEQIKEIVV
jgi:uncharacterized protein